MKFANAKERKSYLDAMEDAAKICDDIKAERDRSMRHSASQRNYVEAANLTHKAFMAGQCAEAIREFRAKKAG
jgi:hypothetical protein